jgi:glutaconyl-CoA/methylmalonyl-CoA decarboxylase subunit gamma
MDLSVANIKVTIEKCEFPFFLIKIGKRKFKVEITKINPNEVECKIKNEKIKFHWLSLQNNIFHVIREGNSFLCEINYVLPKKSKDERNKGNYLFEIKAPVSGLVTKIFIGEGSIVNIGQKLLSLNAMKMENEIYSPVAGKIVKLNVGENKEVNKNEILVLINPTA